MVGHDDPTGYERAREPAGRAGSGDVFPARGLAGHGGTARGLAGHGGTARGTGAADAGGGGTAEPVGRHERPEDWGWHAEFGRWARIGGLISAVVLVLMNVTTHYNSSEDVWIYGFAALIVLMLIRDWYRRRNAWRE